MPQTFPPASTIFRADLPTPAAPVEETPYEQAVARRLRSVSGTLTACSSYCRGLVKDTGQHPFVAALRLAYTDHRPVRISPDAIWLLICQGVAQHVHINAEALRRKLVQHQGKIALQVKVLPDRFHKDSPENPWPEVVEQFSSQIRHHIGVRHDAFVANFSTTGVAEKAASEIVLMDMVERYFDFNLGRVICGIPSIELEGTADDWASIARRTRIFRDLELAWWLDPLDEVLRKFCDAARGQTDSEYWRSIYRIYQPDKPCTPQTALGWFSHFFPYLSDSRGLPTKRNPWLSGARDMREMLEPEETVRHLNGAVYTGVFERVLPTGLSHVPFLWQDELPSGEIVRAFPMEFAGGFVGILQHPSSLSLRPEIGWAVCRPKLTK